MFDDRDYISEEARKQGFKSPQDYINHMQGSQPTKKSSMAGYWWGVLSGVVIGLILYFGYNLI